MPLAETTTGAQLHYVEYNPQAAGPPVIAVHGLLGTAELHLGGVLRWLADRGHRVLGLTLRGYGASLPKPRDFPLQFYHRDAADVLAFMAALHLPRAHLLGYSDGGETVLVAAGTAPQQVASVCAWGAVGSFGPELRPVFQRTLNLSITPEEAALHGITDAAGFARAWVRSTTAMLDAGGDVSLSLAPAMTCPLLLLLGRQDTLNPEAYGRKLVDAAPRGRLLMLDCGHAVHDEQPAAFQQAVGDFLQAAG
ncbi:MAG: alpha/beta hydrolase [Anaerolineae bacterium]|jgi:valacyclovir hydrolase|nr:alpha/beta hydrolase [Anaerolineae bacterium]